MPRLDVNLKNLSGFSEPTDVYVKLSVNGLDETFESTVPNTSVNPTWKGGELFKFDSPSPQTLTVEVWNKDLIEDSQIGTTTKFSLASLKRGEVTDENIPLSGCKVKVHVRMLAHDFGAQSASSSKREELPIEEAVAGTVSAPTLSAAASQSLIASASGTTAPPSSTPSPTAAASSSSSSAPAKAPSAAKTPSKAPSAASATSASASSLSPSPSVTIQQLTPAQKEKMARAFNMFDVDDSGELDPSEAFAAFLSAYPKATAVEINAKIKAADRNSDGVITKEEWFAIGATLADKL